MMLPNYLPAQGRYQGQWASILKLGVLSLASCHDYKSRLDSGRVLL